MPPRRGSRPYRRPPTRKRRRPPQTAATPENGQAAVAAAPVIEGGPLDIPHLITVKDLAALLHVSPIDVIKELMKNGVMASINQTIDFDTAAVVATDLGFEPQEAGVAVATAEEGAAPEAPEAPAPEDEGALQPRPAVVTIMGHVDHGKTSLLDVIRKTNVTAHEAGGITQHIGAYQVVVEGHTITFLDTPGHEAFTAMRARGAQVTDIAVIVVAADDGVMPQTEEAINHARAAGVPLIIAINKMDLAGANPERVKQELAERNVLVEDWGGDVPAVQVSARTRDGLDDLLANILVVAEVQDLKANPDRPALGAVVEAELSSTRGPLATILVQSGTLHAGDVVIAGDTWGRIKAMFDEHGKRITGAGPADPAVVLGLQAVPQAGDRVVVVPDDQTARTIIQARTREREAAAAREQRGPSLDSLFGDISAGKVKDLNVVLKTDVQGSIDPIKASLERLSTDEVKVRVIHSGSGTITESDVMLAVASKGIIIGFQTRVEAGARRLAEAERVDLRLYNVIYELVEDVEKALKGMLEPVIREVVGGHAEVRQVFKIGRRGQIAGSYVRDGSITRGDLVRIKRGDEVVGEGRIDSLRRFQEDVREVQTGYECGIGVDGFDSFEEGDVLEVYRREREAVA